MNTTVKRWMATLAQSTYFDLIGLALVIAISWSFGYFGETLDWVWEGNLSALFGSTPSWAPLVPIGIISVFNSCFSLMSTRLTGRMSNLGNWITLFNVILSMTLDYIFGNSAAIITYPVTFIITAFAIRKWKQTDRYETSKPLEGKKALIFIGLTSLLAFVFSFTTTWLGYGFKISYLTFDDVAQSLIFYGAMIEFMIALIANVLNARKLTLQWPFWTVYNFVSVLKSGAQLNWANVAKYIYYIINSVVSNGFWAEHDKVIEKP